jgi:hypothetical protein
MQKIKPKEIRQKEDGIDFKIVGLLIIESKRFIVLVTLALTLATAIFVYFRPTYISSATIELASYVGPTRYWCQFIEKNNCEEHNQLINSFATSRCLIQAAYPQDSKLNISYSQSRFRELVINVYSTQENTEKKLLEIVTFIKNTHQLKIDEMRESHERLVTLYNNKYNDALSPLNNKIIVLEALKKALIEKLNLLNKIAEKTIDELEIVVTEQHLEAIEIELSTLSQQKIYDNELVTLNEKRELYQALLHVKYYQNSALDGANKYIRHGSNVTYGIVTGLYKKKDFIIILRNLFIGLILSLLIVLFKIRNKIP